MMGGVVGIRKGLPEEASPREAGEMEQRILGSATAYTKALGQGHGHRGWH